MTEQLQKNRSMPAAAWKKMRDGGGIVGQYRALALDRGKGSGQVLDQTAVAQDLHTGSHSMLRIALWQVKLRARQLFQHAADLDCKRIPADRPIREQKRARH